MIIIGVDFHPEFQQIASVDTETGEFQEKRLAHREDAETFYRALASQKVRVGMEASGHARWFERLMAELQLELVRFIRMFAPWRLLEPPRSRARKRPLANFRGVCTPTSC